MRIVYITDQIYIHGGAEKILIQKLNYWAEVYKYDVKLITFQQNGRPPFFDLNPNVEWVDLDVNYIVGKSYFNPVNFTKIPKHFSRLKSEIKAFNPDAVFLISLSTIRYAVPFLAKKYATYYEYHSTFFGFNVGYSKLSRLGKLKKRILNKVVRYVESLYTKVIFLNQTEFEHYKYDNSVIIPNFYDSPPTFSGIDKKNKIISLGRISIEKGYDRLIDIWDIVDKNIDGWELDVYGNGVLSDKFNAEVKKRNFKNPLNFFPAINNVNEKLAEASFYVMTSIFETFPMVLLEAMANQLPIVTFDCPTGPRRIITDNVDGFLVDYQNNEQMAEKILFLINNKEIREQMGVSAINNVERFRPDVIMDKWNELIIQNKK